MIKYIDKQGSLKSMQASQLLRPLVTSAATSLSPTIIYGDHWLKNCSIMFLKVWHPTP